jgi:hypothetical protein
MYVQPLTPPTILPVPQSALNPWELQLDRPAPIQGLSGLRGMGGLGCTACGGTCGGGGGNKIPGWFGLGDMDTDSSPSPDILSPTYSITSLLLHVAAAYIGYKIIKMAFFGEPAKRRREGITHAKRRRARAIQAGNDAVKRAKRQPRITMESF